MIAIYVLFPFALVIINSCKQTADITANPIGLNGMSIGQLISNLNDVVNNPNFLFWHAFGYSVLITILSLVLLALFGAMTAWVICRNKTKWATLIYFTFIAPPNPRYANTIPGTDCSIGMPMNLPTSRNVEIRGSMTTWKGMIMDAMNVK